MPHPSPVPRPTRFRVLVPVARHVHQMIAERSAIVTTDEERADDELFPVYFEGNCYAFPELATFGARLRCAADRLAQRYPTIARALVKASDVQCVGEYDAVSNRLHVTDEAALQAWLGGPPD